jgi:hypothetical protein
MNKQYQYTNIRKIPSILNPVSNKLIIKFFLIFFYKIYNNLVYFFSNFFKLNFYHFYTKGIYFKCIICEKIILNDYYFTKTIPDFDTKKISKELFNKFYFKTIGYCSNCNLFQDFNRPTPEDYKALKKIFESKDKLISKDIWHSFPMPTEEINKYYKTNYEKKFIKWKTNLSFTKPPRKILFIRPTLGFDIKYFKHNFKDIKCYFIDTSILSIKTILNKYKDVKKIDLNIDGILYGEFDKYNNFFDLIICEHTLVHACNLKDALFKLSCLLTSGGKIIFSNEISVKFHNPFHMNFFNELTFLKILNQFFKDIQRIDDSGHKEIATNNFTLKNDNPCFICSK